MTDPIELEIIRNILTSVTEEMGSALQRTAFSPNIKERRDFSCAIFDSQGEAAVMGDHMPVHLGSMPMSVRAALDSIRFNPDDVAILNDPFRGGTHLPDITMISPVFLRGENKPDLFVANRAHHSDVGGMSPGSMPLASEIFQEGLIIPPLKLIKAGIVEEQLLNLILANVRTPNERKGDLNAQIASNMVGLRRLSEIARRYNADRLLNMISELQDYSERMTRAFLKRLPAGEAEFTDFLDDDGVGTTPVQIRVRLSIKGSAAVVDFSGSAPQQRGSINAIKAVTLSAVLYVFKAIIGEEVLANSGIMRPIKLILPEKSIVNAAHPAPVAGGNVETSQRIVDVLLGAFSRMLPGRIPAASSGSMTNFSFGGKITEDGRPFAYYETIAGGHGAGAYNDGLSGRHSHMTNSLNTPVEALEHAVPIILKKYKLRTGSGGKGINRGGEGIIRAFRFLENAEFTLLADRHLAGPYGMNGGACGLPGRAIHLRGDKKLELRSKTKGTLLKGDIIEIHTPGGGGYGNHKRSK